MVVKEKLKETVFGWGINDSPKGYVVTDCPFYIRWKDMVKRVHSEKYLAKSPRYRDVTICKEWKYFWTFRAWMITQDWEGKQLDKDIRIPGNKVYSPDTCMFITSHINSLLLYDPKTYSRANGLPQGVTMTDSGNYRARIKTDGKEKSLGAKHKTPAEASLAYCEAKADYLTELAFEHEQETILFEALLRWTNIHDPTLEISNLSWLTK